MSIGCSIIQKDHTITPAKSVNTHSGRDNIVESALKNIFADSTSDTVEIEYHLGTKMANDEITISIIGTAGRQGLMHALPQNAYFNAIQKCKEEIQKIRATQTPTKVTLVSGGAALSDHVAVHLFLETPEVYNLRLYLPCAWDFKNRKFVDSGERNFRTNPGGTTNYYHRLFSNKFRLDSLGELHRALQMENATYEVLDGFFSRNALVANSHHLIAIGTGENETSLTSGTRHTWNQAGPATRKCFVNLY